MNFYHVFCILSCTIYNVYGLLLPFYIRKCSLSDQNINQCIKENGNLAIPEVVKGIVFFRIPPLAPVHLLTYQLDGQDVKLKLNDLNLYGFENLKITNVIFSLKDKKATIVMTVPYLNIISDYMIVDDASSEYGGGKLGISLVDNQITVKADLATPVKDGQLYFMLERMLMKLKTQRTNYKFDEITTNLGADSEEFVMKHSKILEGQLQPSILKLVKDTFRSVINGITDNVPIRDLFNV